MKKSTLLDLCVKSIVPAVKWNSVGSFDMQVNTIILKYLLENHSDILDILVLQNDNDMIIRVCDINMGYLLRDFDFIPKDWKESHFADIFSHSMVPKIKEGVVSYNFLLPNAETLEKLNGEDWN